MKRLSKRIYYGFTAALLLAVLLCTYLPVNTAKRHSAICRVKAQLYYVVNAEHNDSICLAFTDSPQPQVAIDAQQTTDSTDLSGMFVSHAGHVVTTDSLFRYLPDTLPTNHLQRLLVTTDSLLQKQMNKHRRMLAQITDYAKRHSVIDDGYNEVMACGDSLRRQMQRNERLLQVIHRMQQLKQSPTAVLKARLTVTPSGSRHAVEARKVMRKDGMLVLQTHDEQLPDGASRFSVYRLGTYHFKARMLAFNDFGKRTATDSAHVIDTRLTPAFPAAEGGAWVNSSGQLCGLHSGYGRISSWRVAQCMAEVHCWPLWWWVNAKALWRKWQTNAPQKQGAAHVARKKTANTQLCARFFSADSTLYEGSVCPLSVMSKAHSRKQPQRHGYGKLVCADGTVYDGLWQSDTLTYGTRTDSLGVYCGQFNASLQAHGTGRMYYSNGEFYAGTWKANKRSGHGFSLSAKRAVYCGVWGNDRFRGEQLIFTSDRIYGIDISRYQHEINGRRRPVYPIHWNKLRIRHLGADRRVQGKVDYPVSFVYIKSTEGRTYLNKYYAADLRQARRRGIPVGTYHFFSLTSSGALQARHFLRKSSVLPTDLPPVLDIEPTERQIRRFGEANMFREVRAWLRIVEKQCGKRPVLYISQQFFLDHLKNAPDLVRDYEFWIARYGQYMPYVRLLHWQLTPYGRVEGIRGDVDVNVFNGTPEQFRQYIASHGKRKE